jgi:hypothetical protein
MGPIAEQLATQNVAALREPFEHEDKPVIEAVGRTRRLTGSISSQFDNREPLRLGDSSCV